MSSKRTCSITYVLLVKPFVEGRVLVDGAVVPLFKKSEKSVLQMPAFPYIREGNARIRKCRQ